MGEFARRLMLPVSNDTLLRLVRRRGTPHFHAPIVVGINDWAWRRNQRYGTIICDLERRKTITLLPDREPSTAQAWLSGRPQIAVVARSGQRLRAGGSESAPAGNSGRGSLAFDGKRESRFPRCGAQIRAPDSGSRSARPKLIPICSPPPRRSNTRAICGARKQCCHSRTGQRWGAIKERSCAALGYSRCLARKVAGTRHGA